MIVVGTYRNDHVVCYLFVTFDMTRSTWIIFVR